MRRCVSQAYVQIEVLRSLLGIWLFGALLRRELLAVTGHIYKFIESCDSGIHRWWKSARLEFLTMANLIVFMTVNFALPASNVVFATDAQGANDADAEDHGGYGIVAANLSDSQKRVLWRSSFTPGYSICKLDGSLGRKFQDKQNLSPTIPFTRLPPFLFKLDWTELASGRWAYGDHITAGEARAHWRCLQALGACSKAHSQRYVLLQDNFPVAASMSKGRATAPLLLYYCRRRCGTALAAELMSAVPWVQTALQPADDASRQKSSRPGDGGQGAHGPAATGPTC